MPKVTDDYKENRKQVILDSADICFAKNGYEATTMDEIVSESGTSKGAIYNYFDSKEDIYLSLAERRTKKIRTELMEKLPEGMSPSEKLERLIQHDFDSQTDLERRLDLEFWINASRNEELRKRLAVRARKSIAFLSAIIEEGKTAGEFKKDLNSEAAAELYWSMIDGANSHLMVLKDKFPYSRVLSLTHQLFLNYIKAR